jgi:multicomponent Na+:H+ antiporter subunit E
VTAPTTDPHRTSTWRDALVQFAALFGFWLLLSGQRTPLMLGTGAVSAALVTLVTYRIVGTVLVSVGEGAPGRLRRFGWFLVFLVWLLGKMIAASIQVAYYALDPRLPFEPTFVRFRTQMQRPLGHVILALAITMVPGTLTVHLEGDEFVVHAAIPSAMGDLVDARTQNMIARFLGEPPEPPPTLEWFPTGEKH